MNFLNSEGLSRVQTHIQTALDMKADKLEVEKQFTDSVADWNQNDEFAVDYVKNRPFYTGDPVETVCVEETTLTEWNEYNEHLDTANTTGFVPILDQEYHVTWNGVEYICTAYNSSWDLVAIGNDTLADGTNDTEEPFYIDKDWIEAVTNDASSHTFSIEATISAVTKIEKKYIPDDAFVGAFGTVTSGEIFNNYVNNVASGYYSHAEGNYTTASGNYGSHAEGLYTTASGTGSHAEGGYDGAKDSEGNVIYTEASGYGAHAEGASTKATNYGSHAEGILTTASGTGSHAEGKFTTTYSEAAHAEGHSTTAYGNNAHAEGGGVIASSSYSHAEGYGRRSSVRLTGEANATTYILATSNSYIKEGSLLLYNDILVSVKSYDSSTLTVVVNETLDASVALSNASVILFFEGMASGYISHAEGYGTIASGMYSHSEGVCTVADGNRQHVQGKYNIADTTSAHIVGNGSDVKHSNAHTLDWSGNAWYSGDVYVGSTSGTNKDEGSKKLATEEYVNTNSAKVIFRKWTEE